MTKTVAITLLLAAAGPVAARRPGIPAAIPAGPPQSCIMRSRIASTQVRDDRTIDFFMRGKDVYRNVLPYPCSELGTERAFGYDTSTDQLCSVDIITVVRRSPFSQRGTSCGLGEFRPVTGLKR